MTGPQKSPARKSLNRHLLAGLLVVVVLAGGLGGWSAYARIAGAVIGSGVIVVEGDRKAIQHKEGGIVGEILVKEGDRVKAGDAVVRLDDKLPLANLRIVTKQSDKLNVRIARLSAERDEAEKIVFPEDLVSRSSGEPELAAAIAGETALFTARRNIVEAQRSQTRERIVRLKEEIEGLISQRDAKQEEIDFINEELEGLKSLHKMGHVTLTRIIALKRQRTRLQGELGQLIASIGSAHGRIAEVKIELNRFEQQQLAEISSELRESEASLNELQERRTVAEDQLKRLDITAPVAGIVHELEVHTVGGVISPGATIMSIVPLEDNLSVEARVSPVDIDQLAVGQTARMRFLAFNQRTTPEFTGVIDQISADLSTDKKTGQAYYTIRLRYDGDERLKDDKFEIIPGMPVEVFIQTSERTALSYFIKPLSDNLARTFREQ